ncbi:hypothetical protein T439DRAFT_378991 [Meredithblackwellia eburnea MCA 4105]
MAPSTPCIASLNFAVPETHPSEKRHSFCTVIESGLPLKIAPFDVELEDLRPKIGTLDLDEMGYAAESLPGAKLSGENWEEAYVKESSEWLCNYLKAEKVIAYNHQVRRRIAEDDPEHPKEFDTEKLQPALVAHVDSSQNRAPIRVRETLGLSEEEAKGKRLAVINIWRPLRGPVIDSPLTVCDARTVRNEDITLTMDYYGEGSFISRQERHRWAYLKDMTQDEVLLVRCFDSTKGPSEGGVTPHSAFLDEPRIKSEPFELRQSIEVRCCVLY